MSKPLAYFITFTCYGQWLHGDDRGSVDSEHNLVGEPWLSGNERYLTASRSAQTQLAYQLDEPRRQTTLAAICDVCRFRSWRLWAAHVRTKHVHVVITADAVPEKILTDLKAYASRALNDRQLDDRSRKRWSRHGSTTYVNDAAHLQNVIHYTLFKQGDPQETYDGRNEDNSPRS